jgi:hypothetical protein
VVIGEYNEKIPAEVVAAAEEPSRPASSTARCIPSPAQSSTMPVPERVAAGETIDDGEFCGRWTGTWRACPPDRDLTGLRRRARAAFDFLTS